MDRVHHRSLSNGPRARDDMYVALLWSSPQSISLAAIQIEPTETTTRASSIINLVFLFTRLARRRFDLEKSVAAHFLGPKTSFLYPPHRRNTFTGSLPPTTNPPSPSSGPKDSQVTCRSYEIQWGRRSPYIPHRLTTREPNPIVSRLFSSSATNPLPSLDSKSKPTQATTS